MTPYQALKSIIKIGSKKYPKIAADIETQMIRIMKAPKNERANTLITKVGDRDIFAHQMISDMDIKKMPKDELRMIDIFAFVTSWQYSKGVYQFNKTFFDELIMTDIKDVSVDMEVFTTLPEFGVCIEFPTPIQWAHTAINGGLFGIAIGVDNIPFLNMLLTTNGGTFFQYYAPFKGDKSIAEVVSEGQSENMDKDEITHIIGPIASVINIILYVSMLAGDKGDRDITPPRFIPKSRLRKSKKGLLLEAPHEPVVWRFGDVIGPKLERWIEEEKQRKEGGIPKARGPVRPHYRRAHWRRVRCGKNWSQWKLVWVHQSYVNCTIGEAPDLPVEFREVTSK